MRVRINHDRLHPLQDIHNGINYSLDSRHVGSCIALKEGEPGMRYVLAILACMLLSGCSLIEVQRGMDTAGDAAAPAANIAANLLEDIEATTGKDYISDEAAEKGTKVSNKIADVAAGGRTGLKVVENFIPEKHKPIVGLIDGILGLTVVVSGGLAAFFRRQKKQSDQAVTALIIGADKLPGAGVLVTAAAKKLGVADVVESAYQDAKKTGAVS